MTFSTKQILTNNLNIGFNVMTCLSFKSLFETLFKKYQHNEIIKIKFEDYRLCDIWKNINFEIKASFLNISDVSIFKNAYKISLSGCGNIRNISSLKNVNILDLSYTCITDVSILGNVKELNLEGNLYIADVSMLGNVSILNLAGCIKIKDVSMLMNVKELDLSWCYIDSLGDKTQWNCKKLNLAVCNKIVDISMLKNVEFINLTGCKNVPSYKIEELKKTVKTVLY